METSRILIICGVACIILISYLHIKVYLKKTAEPSIEQAETFKTAEIVKNHKNRKNIYIVRVYSSFDENQRILNSLSDTLIKSQKNNQSFPKDLKIKEIKDREEELTLIDFMNGKRFSENTLCYLFNKISSSKVQIPTLDGVFSPISVNTQMFLNVGMKLKKIPLICTSQYDRCFLHVLKGAIKIRLYDPSQSKYLHRDYQNKALYLKNNSNCFYNSKYTVGDSQSPNGFEKAIFSDVLLREGNLIYIPNFWWFTIEYQEDSVCMCYTSETLVSYIYDKIY
jgi:hypothetical protein